MLSPVALAAGDFLTWRIRLPDSGSSSPPCEKGEKRMEQYTTQMDAARRGIVTKELELVAKKERMTVEELMPLVAEGKVAICANKHHTCIDPEGVGSMLRTKINVNLGVSRDCKDYDVEMEKVMAAVNMGAHAIMDLSSHGNTILNVAEIAQDADINQKQAKDWLHILETLGIIFYLHPYSNNLLKRLVKTPKLYFYDTGLVCYLTKWSSAEVLEYGAMNGAILENYVVSEIAKTYLNTGREPFLYYYRDKDAKEIDIVLEQDGVLNPIEIKKTSNPGTELTKVFSLLDKASVPRGKGAIVCMKPKVGIIDRDNYIVPIWII